MEIFVTFSSDDEALPLDNTVRCWAKCYKASPCIVKVPKELYQIRRRVLADNLSREDYYIIADIGCIPHNKFLVRDIKEAIKEHPNLNMFGLCKNGNIVSDYPSGVIVCKKGAVTKWPQQVSDDYCKEHAVAAENSMMLPDISYWSIADS